MQFIAAVLSGGSRSFKMRGGTNPWVWNKNLLLPPANEVWGKVIFSEACVKNSVHSRGLLGMKHLARRPPSSCQGDPPAKETPLPRRPPSRPTPRGEIEGIRSSPQPRGKLRGSDPGPQPRRKLRGIRSRPTPKGEIKGDHIQAHTQGGNWGGSGPDPPTTTTAAGGMHPTGMHSCLRRFCRKPRENERNWTGKTSLVPALESPMVLI